MSGITIKTFTSIIIALCCTCTVETVAAQSGDGWFSEIELSADRATGNSDYSNLGLSAEAVHVINVYTHKLNFNFDYAESDDELDRNLLELGYQLNRDLSERLYMYGRVFTEREEIPINSGTTDLEYRALLSVGLGVYLIDTDTRTWTIEGGPGSRSTRYELREPNEPDFVVEETKFAFYGASVFSQVLRDNLIFEHDLTSTYTEKTTSTTSTLALIVPLVANLSGKLSHRTDYESDPQPNIKDTDTLLEISLRINF